MGKYKFKEDKYSSHVKVINYLSKIEFTSQNKKKILDIGCCTGYIGANLPKNKFYTCGIDINPEDAKIAGRYYDEIEILDLDSQDLEYKKENFDVIIILDVIEHLRHPEERLIHIRKFLKKNGILIISSPNIANIYGRVKLLLGNFDYDEKGIFDKTHLHFYTLMTFRNLILKSGLKIIKEEFTPIPLPTVHKLFSEKKVLYSLHRLNYLIMNLWKKLFCFQFILYCNKD